MFIKVEQDGSEDVIYRLDQSEVYIGTAPTSHIVIKNNSVSKKHVKLAKEGGHWFAIDQGSTNGTFLDEEQLIPGKRHELSLSSSLRLGNEITLSLMKEAKDALTLNVTNTLQTPSETSTSSEQDKTQVISLEEFQKAKLLAAEKRKKEAKKRRAAELKRKKQERTRLIRVSFISVLVISLGFYANRWWQKNYARKLNKDTIVNKLKNKIKSSDEIELDIRGLRINRGALLPRNFILEHLSKKKCQAFEELAFCENPAFDHRLSGVLKLRSSDFLFFLDENKVIEELSVTFPEYEDLDDDFLKKSVILFSFQKIFSEISPPEASNLYIVLYGETEDERKEISVIGAMNASSAREVLANLKQNDLFLVPERIPSRLTELDIYYTAY